MDNRSKTSSQTFVKLSIALLTATAAATFIATSKVLAQEGMAQEQASERRELQDMHSQTNDIKSEINGALNQLDQISREHTAQQNAKEIHLFAKRSTCELAPGTTLDCMTYNGKLPGPTIRINEGEHVRIVLHNQLSVPTSLLIHGMLLPQSVSGLPRKDAGMVAPGQSYAYQFIAKQAGTFWYHPQVNHSDEKMQGMSGALIVDSQAKSFDKDFVLLISDLVAAQGGAKMAVATSANAAGTACFHLLNGKSAPAIPAIEVRQGERVRLRVINAGQEAVPLHLSGHRFEVVAVNGSDSMEPHVLRDTVTLNPSDRYDLEFAADNPGVWSLASEIYSQSSSNGKFPGGIACVVRYEAQPDSQQ